MASIKAYKGFGKDMKCRDFQYEEGKEYTTNNAKLCESGFHACEYPLDCLKYYNPAESDYHSVDLDSTDERGSDDTKRVGKRIKVGAKLSIKNLVEASIEFINVLINKNNKKNTISERHVRYARSTSCATDEWSMNSATGIASANSTTGHRSANSATGIASVNSATGDWSVNSATGYGSANITTGINSSNIGSEGTINVGWGQDNKCKGEIGAYIVLSECDAFDGNKFPILNAKMGKIDGITLKPDTWYMLKNGEFVEVEG